MGKGGPRDVTMSAGLAGGEEAAGGESVVGAPAT